MRFRSIHQGKNLIFAHTVRLTSDKIDQEATGMKECVLYDMILPFRPTVYSDLKSQWPKKPSDAISLKVDGLSGRSIKVGTSSFDVQLLMQ